MDWSAFFAKFFGFYLVMITMIWLIRKESLEIGVRDILLSQGLFALTGALQLLIGLAVIILHPYWTADWRSLITLIGYLAIIQGFIRLAFPNEFRDILLKSFEKGYWIWIAIAGILGIFLAYNGFTHRV